MEAETIKRHVEALPESKDLLLKRLATIVSLPNVQKVTIDTKEVEVLRQCRESEPVIPGDVPDSVVDVADLIKRIEKDSHPFDPEEHPYFVLEMSMRRISAKRLSVTHIVAPSGDWLAAWLGLDVDFRPGDKCFGLTVVYTDAELMSGKVLLLGSSNPAAPLADVSYGVIIEMGIDT